MLPTLLQPTEYAAEAELRDALTDFASYAQDHPDDTWSPLADLLLDVTKQDVMGMDRQFVEVIEQNLTFVQFHGIA